MAVFQPVLSAHCGPFVAVYKSNKAFSCSSATQTKWNSNANKLYTVQSQVTFNLIAMQRQQRVGLLAPWRYQRSTPAQTESEREQQPPKAKVATWASFQRTLKHKRITSEIMCCKLQLQQLAYSQVVWSFHNICLSVSDCSV